MMMFLLDGILLHTCGVAGFVGPVSDCFLRMIFGPARVHTVPCARLCLLSGDLYFVMVMYYRTSNDVS